MTGHNDEQPRDFGSSFAHEEERLPLYGLKGGGVRDRWIDGEGWDTRLVGHLLGPGMQLTVGVMRRTTSLPVIGEPRVAISAELARESVTMMLVADRPGAGPEVFDLTTKISEDPAQWAPCAFKVNGENHSGYECMYADQWLAYYLTSRLIVFLLGPASVRREEIELVELGPDDVRLSADPTSD